MVDLTEMAVRLYRKYLSDNRGGSGEEIQILLSGAQAVAVAEASICESAVQGGDEELLRSWQEQIDQHGQNVFGKPLTSIVGNSARSSVASAIGLSLAGKRATTFVTGQNVGAAQDLLFSAAGRHLPLVIHLTNIAMPEQGIAGGSGHEGYHLSSETGVFTLFAENAQQAADFSFIARRVAESALVPGLVAIDAGETARSVQDVSILNPSQVRQFIGPNDVNIDASTAAQKLLFGETRLPVPRWHDVDRPVVAGALFDAQSYSVGATGRALYFDVALGDILQSAFDDFANLTGRQYQAIKTHGLARADTVFIVQGAAFETVVSVSDTLQKTGVLGVTSLRPFPDQLLTKYLKGKSCVIVLERLIPSPGEDSPLLRDVRQSLSRAVEKGGLDGATLPPLKSVQYGIGGAKLRAADLAMVPSAIGEKNSATLHIGIDFSAQASHPKRQVLLDEIKRAYPEIMSTGVRAKQATLELAGEKTVSIAIQRTYSDGCHGVVADVAEILYQIKNGTVRTRSAFPQDELAQKTWLEQAADFLIYSNSSVKDPGDDAALDVICASLAEDGVVTPIAALLLQRLRKGGFVVVPTFSSEQMSQMFTASQRDIVSSKSLQIFSVPVTSMMTRGEITETAMGAVFGAIIKTSLVQLKERKILSTRDEALRLRSEPNREGLMECFKNGLDSIELVDLATIPETEAGKGASVAKSAPVILKQLAAKDEQFDSLPRFWNQTGVLYRDSQADQIAADPYIASGTMAPLSATFRDFADKRTRIPQVNPEKCTGCGKCWSVCPDSAIAPLTISPSELIDHGIRQAGADSLRQLANQLSSRILSQARKQEIAPDTEGMLRETYAWLSGKMDQTPDRQQAVEEALDLVCGKIGALPVSVTQEFFENAENVSKDSGELLSLVVNPDTCKDCSLCQNVCDEEAIKFEYQQSDNLASARQIWDVWAAMPDSKSETIERVSESDEVSHLAAINLSRYCLLSMAGGDGAESGSGEKIALRMILSTTEFNQQPIMKRFLDELADANDEIVNEIRELLAVNLPEEDLDLLSKSLESVRTPLVELSELAKNVETTADVNPVDAARLSRLLNISNRLTDLHWRMSSGRQGLGRARYGLAIAPGTVATWATSFPYNPFQSPVVLDFSNETPQLAAGLLEGHLRETCESIALIRQARVEIEQAPGLEFALETLSQLKWQDLTEDERRICPPMLVIGNDKSFGGEALAQVLWSLGSDLPIKIISLADLDLGISGSHQVADSRVNLGLLAITGRSAFVAQTSIADADHLYNSITQAIQHNGPALVRIHSPSPSRHGFETGQTIESARQAVRSRAFPLFTYDPGLDGVHGTRLDLSGNENLDGIWSDDDEPYTPAHWASTEQRFASHFKPVPADESAHVALLEFIELNERSRKGKAAVISVVAGEKELHYEVDDDLVKLADSSRDNWQVLQELAGIVTPFTSQVEEAARQQVQAEHEAEIASIKEEHEQQISELDSSIRSDVAGRVRSQLMRLVNSGSSNSE